MLGGCGGGWSEEQCSPKDAHPVFCWCPQGEENDATLELSHCPVLSLYSPYLSPGTLSSCSQSSSDRCSLGAQHTSQRTQGPLQHMKMHQKCKDTLISMGCSRRQCRWLGLMELTPKSFPACPPFPRYDLSLPRGLPGQEVRALGSAGRLCRNRGCSVAPTGQSGCLYSLVESKDSTDVKGKAHGIVEALL